MKAHTDQQLAANYMGAVARLLGGRVGLQAEFIEKVNFILSGSAPDAMQLTQFIDGVRRTGRPTIWMHISQDVPNVPLIGLVARAGGQVFTIEHCCLWSTPSGKVTHLIPDSFQFGSFVFDADLTLRHYPKPPARNFNAAQKGMVRAYSALRRIEAEQLRRGDEFILPQLLKAA